MSYFSLMMSDKWSFWYLGFQGKDEFLGRTSCSPMVKLNPDIDINPKLLWYPVKNGGKACGDVLLAAELILNEKVMKNKLTYFGLKILRWDNIHVWSHYKL